MPREELDDVDRHILSLLQQDARQTATEIGNAVGVSDTTVLNRIERLEDAGVITGYRATVDYERGGFHRPFLLTCTAPIVDREDLAEQALAIPGVVTVVEQMTGQENVAILAVGEGPEDVTRIASALDHLGLVVVDETVVRSVDYQPLEHRGRAGETDRG